MVQLSLKNVSLSYPVFSKAQLQAFQQDGEYDERVMLNAKGRVLGIKAINDVSFDLRSGDRLGLIGTNGSGKTTLLQIASQIIEPDSGQLIAKGRTSNLININLGMQQGASGQRNITLRGLASGQSLESIEEKRAEIIEFSELHEFIDLPVETYSSGMRMRLNFAITTSFQPEILILDEWLSAGDISFREKATKRMQGFVKQAGVLLLATHSKKLLFDNCEKAIWLDEGNVVMEDAADLVWSEFAKEQERRRKAKEQAGLKTPVGQASFQS